MARQDRRKYEESIISEAEQAVKRYKFLIFVHVCRQNEWKI